MRVDVTVFNPRVGHLDCVIDGDDAAPVAAVIDAIAEHTGESVAVPGVISLDARRAGRVLATGAAPTLYLRGRALDPDTPFAESGIKQGSLLSLGDQAASLVDEPDGVVEIRSVSGPGAGTVRRLFVGDWTIGTDRSCAVRVVDDRVPPVCAVASVALDGTVTIRAVDDAADVLTSTAGRGPEIDGEPLTAEDTVWQLGTQLVLGDVRLELEAYDVPDAAVDDSTDPGWADYNRPPRLLPPERQTTFRLPTPPAQEQNRGLPLVTMFMPVVMGVTLALVTGRWYMLLMAAFAPVMALANWWQTKKHGHQSYATKLAEYRDTKAAIEADVAQALVDERLARRAEAPDAALSLLIATGPRMRLWERRRTDPDYHSIRIGVGDLESEVTVEDPEQLEHKRRTTPPAQDVPVTISLRERGVVGVAGPGDLPRRVAQWAVAQLGVLQSPRDTQIYVLTDGEGAATWSWLRWLPHARPQFGQDTVVTLGTDAETNARRVAELSAMLAARTSALAVSSNTRLQEPEIVVVFDGARRLRSLPGVVALLKQGPAVGIHALCLDADERLLPEEAAAVVVCREDGLTLRQQRVTVVGHVTPDLVDPAWFGRVSRALAPLRDISGGDDDGALPAACRLTDVLDLEPPTPDSILARWALSPRSTEAVIGISLDGPFAIDMRKDGPHGLIAGTTGAGKSELLQSIVASLAVANRPDGMTFVLVDYKGGAAFKDCVDLPHTVGMVTDLDTHLVERALMSLGAELTRREHVITGAGAKDIEDYVDLMVKRPELPAMPRLLIVIDEFASMARELPDFVKGLVNIAQRGRSLGIHLILATQRPSGVVSPEIRANTNLRIALRVTDGSESSDVIDAPDAGNISKSTPGRAYVRLGANSLVPFQSGRVGGRRPGLVIATADVPWIASLAVPALSQPIPMKPRPKVVDDAEITDLTVLVEAIRTAHDRLGLPPQHSPWLEALDTSVMLQDLLASVPPSSGPTLPKVPYALEDRPLEQARRNASLDFATFSHLGIVGGARSGRSQALRTIAGSIASLTSPADVHLYGLDCGNGGLLPLTDLPHCGAVVQRSQTDRAIRLFGRLKVEMTRRQELLAAGGYADLEELRRSVPADERLPHIVFMIDRWESFMGSLSEIDSGALLDAVQTFLREGASVGVHLIIAGDRQVASARIGALIEEKFALRLADRGDYSYVSLRPATLPETIEDGRAFRAESGLEMQIALLDEDPSGQSQAAALRAIGAEAKERFAAVPRSQRPFRVDVLPARITFDEAWEMLDRESLPALWAMVGVGGDELTAQVLDLARTPVALVGGPPRSGRSTLLLSIVESALRQGAEVVVAAPRPSPLRDLAGRDGVRAVLTGTELTEEQLTPLFDTSGGTKVLFVVDDGELLKDVEAKDYLRRVQRTAADHGLALVVGGDGGEIGSGFTGWQVEMKGRQGVLINPQGTTEGELIGMRLSRSALTAPQQAGRVLAHLGDGVLQTLQAPVWP